MATEVTAWEEDTPVATIWPTEADAITAERTYNANILFEALLDEERNVVQFATLDDLVALRTELEAIFDTLDGV